MNGKRNFELGIWGLTALSQIIFLATFLVKTRGSVGYADWKKVDGVLYYSTESYQATKWMTIAVLVVILFELSVTLWGIYSKTYLATFASCTGMLLYFGMFIQVFYNNGANLQKHVIFTLAGMVFMWGYYFLVRVKLSDQHGKLVMFALSALIVISLAAWFIGIITKSAKYGSYAWISIGGFSIQPGEFLKVLIILLSAWIYKYRNNKMMTRLYLLFCAAAVFVLVLAKDLGNAVVLLAICLVSSWFIFDKWYYTALAMSGGVGALLLAGKFVPYVRARFEACFHALESGSGQQYQSLMAILKNGLGGCGPAGEVVSATYITSSATDLTFNSFVAIYGIILAMILVLFVIVLFVQILITPVVSPFHYMLGILGVTTLFAQYIIHIGGNLNVIPLTGICMNFISTGGSNMLASFMILGGILSCLSPGFEPVKIKVFNGGKKHDYKYSREKMHRHWLNDRLHVLHGLCGLHFNWKRGRYRYRKSEL